MAISQINTNSIATGAVTAADLASGAITAAALPAGSVLQVVSGTTSTAVSASTNTYVDTTLSASITPSSASSKILVIVDQNGCAKGDGSNAYMGLKLLRSSSTISTFSVAGGYTGQVADNRWGSTSMCYLDSPSSTSSITYKTQFCCTGGVSYVRVQDNSATSGIILMEIAA